ncbi:hypothetical protein DEAC_c22760 [Desulfosporosinus acididurans]|uniref:Uncharacterized protein n=1 Tax=Desulfosporosinus acididurans TaxID=476652 RepID=A0A0J1ILS1_9FIRM|nr:hypothetical protein DEAC_c22760 [Desulfosporosinus acididurans]
MLQLEWSPSFSPIYLERIEKTSKVNGTKYVSINLIYVTLREFACKNRGDEQYMAKRQEYSSQFFQQGTICCKILE